MIKARCPKCNQYTDDYESHKKRHEIWDKTKKKWLRENGDKNAN